MTGSGSTWSAIVLVAAREISVRVTSKSFLWTTAFLVAAIVGGGLALDAVNAGAPGTQVVAVPAASAQLGPALEAAGTATGVPIEVRQVDGDGVAELRAGDVGAVVEAVEEDGAAGVAVTVVNEVPAPLAPALAVLAQQLALSDQITTLGGDPAQVAGAVATAEPAVVTLEEESSINASQALTGMASGVLIFIAIIQAGQLVAVGVVEEKTSRVVELLLATIRPAGLMAGKVLGIGLVGLLQLGAVLVAAVGTASVTGALQGTGVDIGSSAVWVLVWFLLGFAMYALVLAALGALVSRQEDVQTVVTPVIVVATIPYVIGVAVAPNDPGSSLVQWLSFVPFFAPFLMPIRIGLGAVEAWEMAVSLVLAVVTIPVLVWLAGTIYRNAVLRTGARVPLREALRSR